MQHTALLPCHANDLANREEGRACSVPCFCLSPCPKWEPAAGKAAIDGGRDCFQPPCVLLFLIYEEETYLGRYNVVGKYIEK